MDVNDFKLYSAKVRNGSGVIFQPMNKREYTYILTANHNLLGKRPSKEDSRLKEEYVLSEIDIFIQSETDPIKIELVENEYYFPHKDADIAILKIDYLDGFENIFVSPNYKVLNDSFICGYPGYRDGKLTLQEKYTNYELSRFIDERDYFCKGQLTSETKEQEEITGLSGGGLMRIDNNNISLIGIQSEVASQIPNGQIEFVPIKYFDDIINYPENEGKLCLLLPPFMGAFEYLKNEIIKLEDASQPSLINKIKSAFSEQMKFIGLNPYLIYNSNIGSKLLADRNSNPFSKELWVSWLEYLTILCFVEDKNIDINNIEAIFNKKRLIHSDTNLGWLEIIPDLLKNNLDGLENNGTLIVSTKNVPLRKNKRRYRNSVIPNIYSAYGNRNLGVLLVDQAKNIKSLKEIIHIKAFENDCILESEDIFNNISEFDIENIILELKNKLNEFFES